MRSTPQFCNHSDQDIAKQRLLPANTANLAPPTPQLTPPDVLIQRARWAPRAMTPGAVLQLQRTIGNQAVGQLLAPAACPPPVTEQPTEEPRLPQVTQLPENNQSLQRVITKVGQPEVELTKAEVAALITEKKLGPAGARFLHFLRRGQRRVAQTTAISWARHRDGKRTAAPKKFSGKRRTDTSSSTFRHEREMQLYYGGTRNIGKLKFKKGGQTVYVMSRSLGLGVERFTLADEPAPRKRRHHSEGGMAATVKSKRLKLSSGEIVNLGGHTLEYPASTNDLCVDKPGQQNCAGYPRAVIEGASKEKFFTHNAYGGSDDSGEFEKGVKEHYGKGYESEGESEDEGDTRVFVIDDEQIRGEEDLGSKPIPAYEWRPGKGPQT